ncbi:MAG: hypothetical protein EOO01_06395, partial [Chitinophagaceae bacterium]
MDFQKRYQFNPATDLIGEGIFSRVYRATDLLLDRTVALKYFTPEAAAKYDILKRIKKIITLDHHNICKYYDVALLTSTNILGETESVVVGIMEFLEGGNFRDFVKAYPAYTDKLLVDVLNGLQYLHKRDIIYRDLKPENILIRLENNEPVAKLTDVGITRLSETEDTDPAAMMGTLEYMPPEQLNPKRYGVNGSIGTNLDLWSFGLIVYETVTNNKLFGSTGAGMSAGELISNILHQFPLAEINALHGKYKQIVNKCVVKVAGERVQDAGELIALFGKDAVSPGKLKQMPGSAIRPSTISSNDDAVAEPLSSNAETKIGRKHFKDANDGLAPVNSHKTDQKIHSRTGNSVEQVNGDREIAIPVSKEKKGNVAVPGTDRVFVLQPETTGRQASRRNGGDKTPPSPLVIPSSVKSTEEFTPRNSSPVKPLPGKTSEQIDENAPVFPFESRDITHETSFPADEDGRTGQSKLRPGAYGASHREIPSATTTGRIQTARPLTKYQKEQLKNARRTRIKNIILTIIVAAVIGTVAYVNYFMPAGVAPMENLPAATLPDPGFETPPLVKVPGGNFMMGSDDPGSLANAGPVHPMNLADFSIGKYEVTVREFSHFISETKYVTTADTLGFSWVYRGNDWVKAENVNWTNDIRGKLIEVKDMDLPVIHVSWQDATHYCEWLSKKTGHAFRLPTETEWEYAARGGNKSGGFMYSGANNLDLVGWYEGNSKGAVSKVGLKQPNELGIHDMSGNVMEWCYDFYNENHYARATPAEIFGPISGTEKVARGGSWFTDDLLCRSTFRMAYP